MLDVGEQQFQMLLFVVQTDLDDRQQIITRLHARQQRGHSIIDMASIALYFVDARSSEQASKRPGMPRADRIVVGVE